MKKVWILCLLIVYSSAATAEVSDQIVRESEPHHQASSKNFELAGDISLAKSNIRYTSSVGASESTLLNVTPGLEYGLTSFVSLGLATPYLWRWTNPGDHAVSWADPSVFTKLRAGLPAGTLHAQFSYARSIDHSTSGKNYSGGTSISPAIGYEISHANNLLGARLEYTLMPGERKISELNHEVDYLVKGGELFKCQIFLEHEASQKTYGFSISMLSRARSTKRAVSPYAIDSSIASGLPLTRNYTAPQTNMLIQGYVPMNVSPSATLVPRLSYEMAQAYDKANISSASAWQLEMVARYIF